MLLADELMKNQTIIDDRWWASRPVVGPFLSRLRDAWSVIRGRADAVKFYKQ